MTGDASGEVDLSWDDPDDDTITQYTYQFPEGSSNWSSRSIPGSDGDTTTHTVTGLTDGTEYGFRIVAQVGNILGLFSTVVTATPLAANAPAAPTGLTATAGNQQVTLSWTAPSGTVTKY